MEALLVAHLFRRVKVYQELVLASLQEEAVFWTFLWKVSVGFVLSNLTWQESAHAVRCRL
jgi:hypothetical protein